MYEELAEILQHYVNDERRYVMLTAYQVLNDLGLSDHDTELLNIFGLSSEMTDSDQFVGRIDACLTYAVGGCLHQYGLTCKPGTPLDVMTQVLQAVGTFERYFVEDGVYQVLCSDELDDIDKLGELIPLFSSLTYMDVLEYVEAVRPTTLERMKTIVKEELSLREEAAEPVPQRLHRVQRINAILRETENTHPAIVRQIASEGVKMGGDIEDLIDQVCDQLDQLENTAVVWELLGLAIYASPDYYLTVVKAVEHFTDDPREQDMMLDHVRRFLNEMGWHYAQA